MKYYYAVVKEKIQDMQAPLVEWVEQEWIGSYDDLITAEGVVNRDRGRFPEHYLYIRLVPRG